MKAERRIRAGARGGKAGTPDRPYRLGVDIGGTFTDFALLHIGTGDIRIDKRLTTPADPARAVLDGIASLSSSAGVSLAAVDTIVHGTTLASNAVIERKGVRTGLLTTNGYRDTLELRRETRYDLYDLQLQFPDPLVARVDRLEVRERIGSDGRVVVPIDLDSVREAATFLVEQQDVQSLAICFLHAYRNPSHEEQAKAAVTALYPGVHVSISSRVFPHAKEYERTCTTVVNAYVQPILAGYLKRIESWLQTQGFRGHFFMMTSGGGMVSASTARELPVRLLESGPVAGVLMASAIGQQRGDRNLLAFDMGGTTSKGSVVRRGRAEKAYEFEIARVHKFKVGSGIPVQTPVVRLVEIGSGGGSLAWIDRLGLLRVGPQSAGASPGPVCYGQGGNLPTITDADLVLGYVGPESFLGGRMRLDLAAARDAILRWVAEPLGLDLTAAAWGIHEVANEDIARAFRVHAAERGMDVRGFSLVAFGGAGPVHAVRVARKLHMFRVVVPLRAGVFSALGLLTAPPAFDVARTDRIQVGSPDFARAGRIFEELEALAHRFVASASLSPGATTSRREVDVRYQGQGHEVTLDVSSLGALTDPRRLRRHFEKVYQRTYATRVVLDEELEVVNWRVEIAGRPPSVNLGLHEAGSGIPKPTGHREVYFPEVGGYVPAVIYARADLRPGDRLAAPAIVEEGESSCVIPPGLSASIDRWLNVVIETTGGTKDDV